MKKLVFPIAIVSLLISSCASTKYLMSETEIKEKGYAIDGWNVKVKDSIIGTLNTTEWELYKNDLRREISITTIGIMSDADVKNLIRFIHTKFPDYKIEVNMDDTFRKEN